MQTHFRGTISRWLGGALAAAVWLTASAAAQQQKKAQNQQEFDLSNAAFKSIQAQNWTKALVDLQAWKDQFPKSDWKDDRDFYILQGYVVTQQYDKAVTFGNEFIDRDLPSAFKDSLGNVIASYYIVANAANELIKKDATREQIAIGDKAAHKLLTYAPTYFVPANMPAGQSAQAFDQTKTQMLAVANSFLLLEEVTPGTKAMTNKDCPGAEAAFTKALTDYPDNSWIAHQLARAYNCEQKPFQAMYEFARAAAVDPTLGKTQDGPKFTASVKKMYVTLHGDDSGYDELLTQAKSTPVPAADFKIATAEERKAKAADDFAKANPEIALWQGIKTNLTQQGPAFFDSMRGAEIAPGLLATIAEAKPACRPKELILYVPAPENTAKTNEITLKFETPLAGKPEIGSNIKFVAVADSFTPAPFMLTMTAEKEKVQDLKLSPCTPAAAVRKKK